MREFTVKSGNFKGVHKIYDSEKELFENENVSFVRKPWSSPDAKVGEWCRMDDGFIAQLLDRYQLTVSTVYRFAFGSRGVYYRKRDDKRVAPLFYTTNPSSNKSALVSAGYERALGKSYDKRKRLWVELVAAGMDPYEATYSIYRIGPTGFKNNGHKIAALTNKLIRDTKVREHLVEALKPFKQELTDQIKEKTGLELGEFIAQKLAEALGSDAKSVKDKIAIAKLAVDMGQLIGNIPVKVQKSTRSIKRGKVEEADFEEVPPPSLSN